MRLAVSLRRFHERFILKRLPYIPHEGNCLHLGEHRGTPDVFKAHRKHPFRSVDGHGVEHVPDPSDRVSQTQDRTACRIGNHALCEFLLAEAYGGDGPSGVLLSGLYGTLPLRSASGKMSAFWFLWKIYYFTPINVF